MADERSDVGSDVGVEVGSEAGFEVGSEAGPESGEKDSAASLALSGTLVSTPSSRDQVEYMTAEVKQDSDDPANFSVSGKDKSWFIQNGGILFKCEDPTNFRLKAQFGGGARNHFADAYADLSMAEQKATINWLIMLGIAFLNCELTGYRDCKDSGFYFLFHLNYRRTAWRIIGCPHNCEVVDLKGKTYTCNPQRSGQFELRAYEGQVISVEYADNILWILDGKTRVASGRWRIEDEDVYVEYGELPRSDYLPAVLTSNCPTEVRIEVD